VVQGDNLLGDRQWWVTKPYVWWKLLLAKLLFILLFICVPLFHVQLFLLHRAGFPVLPNLLGVFRFQLSLYLLLLLLTALACLTRNLGQALLGVGIIFAAIAGMSWLINSMPSGEMSSAAENSDAISPILVFGSVMAASLWQFARRKTWYSRALILGALAVSGLMGVFTPYQSAIEKKYPLVPSQDAPAKFTILQRDPSTEPGQRWIGPGSVMVSLPVDVSGILPESLVRLDAIIVRPVSSTSGPARPGWKGQWQTVWPEGGQLRLTYLMKRDEYEKFKAEKVQVEVALTEYRETNARETVIDTSTFAREGFGICRLFVIGNYNVQCLHVSRELSVMATFDPNKANCTLSSTEEAGASTEVSHYWNAPGDDFFNPKLNPVEDYSLNFQTKPILQTLVPGSPAPKHPTPQLCLGAPLHLATPQLKRQVRITLDTSHARLQDLVELPSEP
jgi:hypothetical protein